MTLVLKDHVTRERPKTALAVYASARNTVFGVGSFSLSLSFSVEKRETPSSIVTSYILPWLYMYTASQVSAVFPFIRSINVPKFSPIREDNLFTN